MAKLTRPTFQPKILNERPTEGNKVVGLYNEVDKLSIGSALDINEEDLTNSHQNGVAGAGRNSIVGEQIRRRNNSVTKIQATDFFKSVDPGDQLRAPEKPTDFSIAWDRIELNSLKSTGSSIKNR